MHIVNVDGLLHGVHSELISGTKTRPTFHPSSRHPEGEPLVMVPTTQPGLPVGLLKWSPSKFRCPDYERLFQHATCLQVQNEGRDTLIGSTSVIPVIANKPSPVPMSIPLSPLGPVENLDEANSGFNEASCGKAMP